MQKAKIKNIASGIEKNCDILRKNDNKKEKIVIFMMPLLLNIGI